jgi:CheY-like chemotaxis protein
VLNAMESLGPGGKLTVSTGFSAETRTVTVIIEDTGSGMTEETLSRMFDSVLHHQAARARGWAWRWPVRRRPSRGDLAIHSTVGKAHGSAFGCRWTPSRRAPRRSARMRHTVLVVDDEASIADGLRLTLEAEGYSVRIAGSVRTALARWRRPRRTWRSSISCCPTATAVAHPRSQDAGSRPRGHRDHRLRLGAQGHGGDQGGRAFHIVEKPSSPTRCSGS